MEYSIQALAKIAGISARTLRYYDEIGLLCPCRTTAAGYRVYGAAEIGQLQQILLYRALGFPLREIARMMHAPDFDRAAALRRQRDTLCAERARLSRLITAVEKTLDCMEGDTKMNDAEKFEALKARVVAQNEALHGAEIRAEYGDAAMDEANARVLGLTAQEHARFSQLQGEILTALADAVRAGEDPTAEAGRRIAQMHREWLGYSWKTYTAGAHKGLAQTYLADPRFTAYYDRAQPGCARFVCEAIDAWADTLAREP